MFFCSLSDEIDDDIPELVNEKDLSSEDVLKMVTCVSDCVSEIISRYKKNKEIDVRKIKNTFASKHGLARSPKLVDIIAAVPEEYRKPLQSVLTAKPIRSASGVSD